VAAVAAANVLPRLTASIELRHTGNAVYGNNGVTFPVLREASDRLQLHSLTDAMNTIAFRTVAVVMISAPLLIFSQRTTSAATVTVTVVGNYTTSASILDL
jgi:hypothetical protein